MIIDLDENRNDENRLFEIQCDSCGHREYFEATSEEGAMRQAQYQRSCRGDWYFSRDGYRILCFCSNECHKKYFKPCYFEPPDDFETEGEDE